MIILLQLCKAKYQTIGSIIHSFPWSYSYTSPRIIPYGAPRPEFTVDHPDPPPVSLAKHPKQVFRSGPRSQPPLSLPPAQDVRTDWPSLHRRTRLGPSQAPRNGARRSSTVHLYRTAKYFLRWDAIGVPAGMPRSLLYSRVPVGTGCIYCISEVQYKVQGPAITSFTSVLLSILPLLFCKKGHGH